MAATARLGLLPFFLANITCLVETIIREEKDKRHHMIGNIKPTNEKLF